MCGADSSFMQGLTRIPFSAKTETRTGISKKFWDPDFVRTGTVTRTRTVTWTRILTGTETFSKLPEFS